MKSLYLYIDLLSVLIPFLFSFHPRFKFYSEWKSYIPAMFITASFFVIWDMLYTSWNVWGFNPDYLLGLYIYNLPIEEILFFICIPYACTFSYHCLKTLLPKIGTLKNLKIWSGIVGTVLLIFSLLHLDQLYTFAAFLSAGICIILLPFITPKYSLLFYILFLFMLVPFFIVNGILTGTGIEQPVVWYNNLHNLKIRALTIPIEDFFYGFSLLAMNIMLYEKIKSKFESQSA